MPVPPLHPYAFVDTYIVTWLRYSLCSALPMSRRERGLTSRQSMAAVGSVIVIIAPPPGQAPLPSSSLPSTHSLSQTELTRYKVGGGGLKTALISKTYRAARSSTDAPHLAPLPRTAALHIRSGFFLVCLVLLFSSFSLLLLLVYLVLFFIHQADRPKLY